MSVLPPQPKLMPGERQSIRFPGFVEMPDGRCRARAYVTSKSGKRYATNHYFKPVHCSNCGVAHLQNQSNAKKGNRPFCSTECRKRKVVDEADGRIIRKSRQHGVGSHVLVKRHGHHRADSHGYVPQHVLVAEAAIKREISKLERVHHINCIKDDNRPENLFVCADDKEHFLIHGTLNKCVAELIAIGALEFDRVEKSYKVRKA